MDGFEKGREPLYQVWAEETDTGKLVAVPYFPRAMQQAAEEWASLMRQMIAQGKEKRYSNPQARLHLGNLKTFSGESQ